MTDLSPQEQKKLWKGRKAKIKYDADKEEGWKGI